MLAKLLQIPPQIGLLGLKLFVVFSLYQVNELSYIEKNPKTH